MPSQERWGRQVSVKVNEETYRAWRMYVASTGLSQNEVLLRFMRRVGRPYRKISQSIISEQAASPSRTD